MSEKQDFVCPYNGCEHSYSRKFRLQEHISMTHKRITRSVRNSLICSLCKKQFNWKSNLEEHKRNVHGDTQQLACSRCPKVFKSQILLKKHQKCHENVQCNLCSQTYSQNSIGRHRKICTGSIAQAGYYAYFSC